MSFSKIVQALGLVAKFVEQHSASLQKEFEAGKELIEQIKTLMADESTSPAVDAMKNEGAAKQPGQSGQRTSSNSVG